MLRVRITNLNEVDQVRVALNGEVLDQTPGGADGFRKINEMYKMINKEFRVMGQWLLFSLPPQHYPRMGSNTVVVTLLSTDPEVLDELVYTLHDVEVHTKYLMGKSFMRGDDYGVDPDLAPLPSLVHSRL